MSKKIKELLIEKIAKISFFIFYKCSVYNSLQFFLVKDSEKEMIKKIIKTEKTNMNNIGKIHKMYIELDLKFKFDILSNIKAEVRRKV